MEGAGPVGPALTIASLLAETLRASGERRGVGDRLEGLAQRIRVLANLATGGIGDREFEFDVSRSSGEYPISPEVVACVGDSDRQIDS